MQQCGRSRHTALTRLTTMGWYRIREWHHTCRCPPFHRAESKHDSPQGEGGRCNPSRPLGLLLAHSARRCASDAEGPPPLSCSLQSSESRRARSCRLFQPVCVQGWLPVRLQQSLGCVSRSTPPPPPRATAVPATHSQTSPVCGAATWALSSGEGGKQTHCSVQGGPGRCRYRATCYEVATFSFP